jgi:hypothetical protein
MIRWDKAGIKHIENFGGKSFYKLHTWKTEKEMKG